MKFDTFTFNRPSFYQNKAKYLYKLKKSVYLLSRKDLDGDWQTFLRGREFLLKQYCSNKKVLDVGCGVGDFLDELNKNFSAGPLFGVDISQAMVAEARKKNPGYNYFVGSGDRLPFADNSFDVVTFQWVFHHLSPETARATLNEAKRVCRDAIFVQDTIRYDSGPMHYLSLLYWKMADGGVFYQTLTEWQNFFTAHGLNIIETQIGNIMRTGFFVLKPMS